MSHRITRAEMDTAVANLRASSKPLSKCPKCGKNCYEANVDIEAIDDLVAAGYDGTCCWMEESK